MEPERVRLLNRVGDDDVLPEELAVARLSRLRRHRHRPRLDVRRQRPRRRGVTILMADRGEHRRIQSSSTRGSSRTTSPSTPSTRPRRIVSRVARRRAICQRRQRDGTRHTFLDVSRALPERERAATSQSEHIAAPAEERPPRARVHRRGSAEGRRDHESQAPGRTRSVRGREVRERCRRAPRPRRGATAEEASALLT